MSGFIGSMYDMKKELSNEEVELYEKLNMLIRHRGPDDDGFYFDEYVRFRFRRLSVIDVASGHQPLSYENDRYWIIFNGEIYNYLELKKDLMQKGYTFTTESDTEVIVALYCDLKEKMIDKLRGMFAFIIWDKEEKALFGARDQFGIKPFYFIEMPGQIHFSSEEKLLHTFLHEQIINQEALQHFFSFQYVPESKGLVKQIERLQPGHYFIKKLGKNIKIVQYFRARLLPTYKREDVWIDEIRKALYDSVEMHLRGDVPIGAFLSGGIDSSLITAIAKEFNPKLKTFSVGFAEEGYSEVELAQETAANLGIENISYIITPEEYIKELPKIIWSLDHPLADPACVPLYFAAREAKQHVKAVLSGEGADELFGGYQIYREPFSLKGFEYLPNFLLKALHILAKVLPDGVKGKSFLLRGTTPLEERYIGNAKLFNEEEKERLLKVYNRRFPYTEITKPLYNETIGYHPVERMQYIDIHTWLSGDILLKADRMTMANSLELRVPFLDQRVYKVARSLPVSMKINGKTTKYILRKAAEGIVPDDVLNRKKLGFPVPIRLWLKNELYEWAFKQIKDSPTDEYINKEFIFKLLEDHVKGKADHSRKIWAVIIFMVWHAVYIENKYIFRSEKSHLLLKEENFQEGKALS